MRRTLSSIRRSSAQRGFSLIELLVVIGIIALISGVILMRYGSFNSVILLKSLAYEVALTVREAQTYGVSVRSDGGTFTSAFGVHFDTALPKQYILFIDRNLSYTYNLGEEVTIYNIGQGNSIKSLCGNENCTLQTLDVTFRRPEPDAYFSAGNGSINANTVRVILTSVDTERTVRVWTTGQISVE